MPEGVKMRCIDCLRTAFKDEKSTPERFYYWCQATGKDIEDVSAFIQCDKGLTIKQLHANLKKKKGK